MITAVTIASSAIISIATISSAEKFLIKKPIVPQSVPAAKMTKGLPFKFLILYISVECLIPRDLKKRT